MSVRQAKSTSSKSSPPKRKPERSSPSHAVKSKRDELVDDELDTVANDDGDGGGGDGGGGGGLDDELDPELGPEAGKSALKEDPVLDRRIIEGMLRDRKILLDDLAKEGMTQGQVLRRAAELGLSEALLRQVKGVAADLAGERPGRRAAPSTLGARTCLSCDRVFLSTGPGNRLCMRCRGGDAGLAQF